MFGGLCAFSLYGIPFGIYGKPDIDYVSNEILVEFSETASLAGPALAVRLNAKLTPIGPGHATLTLPKGTPLPAVLNFISRSGLAKTVEPNYIARGALTPNDPGYPSQYGIPQTFTNVAWDLQRGGQGIVVAVLDTGIDRNHPELAGRVLPGYDFVNRDANPHDDNGHGTLCAGVIAAKADNGMGIAGVAFNSVILPVKVLDRNANGSYGNIAQGIRWAANWGADVISLSLAGTSSSSTLQSAVNYAYAKGCVVVAAAGNFGNNRRVYPAAYPKVISVGAINRQFQRVPQSSYGSWVDVAAPGDRIYSTYPGGSYRTVSGTSMACAFVAGEAALLQRHLGFRATPATIEQRIKEWTTPVGSWVANGLIHVSRALEGEAP